MSTTYIAVVVNLLSFFLPKLGINAGSEELTSIIQGFIVAGSGLWVLYRRYQAGGVSKLGFRA